MYLLFTKFFYRIMQNYTKYFTEGDTEEAKLDDYHSHNTRQMGVKEMEELLLTLPYVQEELKN